MQTDTLPQQAPETLPAAKLITTPSGLADLVQTLARESIIAVDTESNGLHAYREQVCLIQFSTQAHDYLVDPFELDNLSLLGEIFENPSIEKIFHAADYDILCLKRDFGFRFANLFDTMLAARILGKKTLGLGSLIEAEFGVILDKRFQRADWGRRPISDEMLTYARLDTHYLITLRQQLQPLLVAQNRWELAQEDFARLCSSSEPSETPEGNGPHIPGAHELTPQQYTVLLELCSYREQVARNINRPIFKVFNAETLLDIARYCPGNMSELSKLHGMTHRAVDRHGRQLLSAVRRGLEKEPVQMTRPPRPSDAYLNRMDRLRNWRKAAAQKMNVESDVVLPKEIMLQIAEQAPRELEQMQGILKDTPWRFQEFGSQILEAIWPPPRRNR